MTIEERVSKIIVEQLGVQADKVTPNASFTDDLGADPLEQIELIMEIEQEFDIEIPEEDAEKLTTVGELISYIKKKELDDLEKR